MHNIVVLGTSCFEGMASSKRIRNLIEPLLKDRMINVSNLIFQSETNQLFENKGEKDGIKFMVIGYRLSNFFSLFGFFRQGFLFIKQHRKSDQKNIIYNYGGPNVENILFILYGKAIGFKIICDIVEDNRYEPTVNFLNKFKTRSSIYLLNLSKYYASSLIGISSHLCRRLENISKGKVPVYLIPISVNLQFFDNISDQSKSPELKVFYGGSFNEKDGLDLLIDAFSEVSKIRNNIKLIITGLGSKPDTERLLSHIDKAGNSDKILFKGFLNNDEYYSLLNECDIFCMTRINSNHAITGFPFKLGEFLASGKAVIATNIGDVSNYLTDKVNAVVINPSSVSEIYDAILFLVDNPYEKELIGKEGRKAAEYYFDSGKVSKKLLSIFDSV